MDNMFKKQMLISRSKLKDLLPTVTDEQLDNLYKTQDDIMPLIIKYLE